MQAALFQISDDKVTISAKQQKKFGPFNAFIDSF